MKRSAIGLLLLLVALPLTGLRAQQSASALNETQARGNFLFNQRCYVCHAPSQSIASSAAYGPRLNKQSVQGDRDKNARKVIAEGAPRMPGFRYGLEPSEIDAIVEYLKTVEKAVDIEKPEAGR